MSYSFIKTENSTDKSSPQFNKVLLVLDQGTCFEGYAFGALDNRVGEVVFNTSMTGYQEILTDPSYYQQIVVLTYPHIGNTGVNLEDLESKNIWVSGLVVKDLPVQHSNWRNTGNLSEWMRKNNALGIAGIDTRSLTNILRKQGSRNGYIMVGDDANYDEALKQAKHFAGLSNVDLAKEVTTDKIYEWHEGSWCLDKGYRHYPDSHFKASVVVYDFGVKKNMLRLLVDLGYRLTIVPATTPADEVIAMQADGVLLSNGPGDPAPCDYAITAIQQLIRAQIPIFGICLGHQLLALACGAKTTKMKFGHHGANHPVKNDQGKVIITSQNHGFAVESTDLPSELHVTHHSLFDGSIQGLKHRTAPALSFQGHPEASPGPHDALGLFASFEQLIQQKRA